MKKELPFLGGSRGAYNFNVPDFFNLLIKQTIYLIQALANHYSNFDLPARTPGRLALLDWRGEAN
jgi:hypothetical protein